MRGYNPSRYDTVEDWSPPVRSSVQREEAAKNVGESYFQGLVGMFNYDNWVDEEPRQPTNAIDSRSTSRSLAKDREPSTFEKTMDYIAFPEKHIDCSNVRLDLEETTAEDIQKAFEKAMDCVTYPERHITYEKVGIDASQLMDVLAFPERHFKVPELVISDVANANAASSWSPGQASKATTSAISTPEPTKGENLTSRTTNCNNPSSGNEKCEHRTHEENQIPKEESVSASLNEAQAILSNKRDMDALDYAFNSIESLVGLANNEDSYTETRSKSTNGNRSTTTLELKPRLVDRTRSLVSDSSVSTNSTASKAPPTVNNETTRSKNRGGSTWEQTLKNRSITRYVKKDAVANWVSPAW